MTQTLQGKTMLITGASSGFGEAIAIHSAAAGADIALVARREAEMQAIAGKVESLGRRALVCPADLADESQINNAVERTLATFGQVDVLVNNAGTNFRERSILDTASDQWARILAVNLTAAFLFTKLLLPGMIAREQGSIINIGSLAGVRISAMPGVGYTTSKLALEAVTRQTNLEANPHNVRACLLCPGDSNTPILDRRPAPPPYDKRGEMLQPEDIAETVIFLASLPPRVNIEHVVMTPTRDWKTL